MPVELLLGVSEIPMVKRKWRGSRELRYHQRLSARCRYQSLEDEKRR